MSSLILARLAHCTNISKHIIVAASIYDFLIMMVSLSTTVIPLLYYLAGAAEAADGEAGSLSGTTGSRSYAFTCIFNIEFANSGSKC